MHIGLGCEISGEKFLFSCCFILYLNGMLISGCLIIMQKGTPVVGNVPAIVRSQKKRAVSRAGDTDESSKDPVSQSLPAYHFHDLNPKSTDLGN